MIARVEKDGFGILGAHGIDQPRPISAETLKRTRFPMFKQKLSPSLLWWLTFDGRWLSSLGWFSGGAQVKLAPLKIAAFAPREFSARPDLGGAFAPFAERLCHDRYLLRTDGTRSTALYVAVPDSVDEHAVMLLELADGPRVALRYPGFDVYLADRVGLFGEELPPLEEVAQSVAYRTRMKEDQYRGSASKAAYRETDLP